MPPTTLAMMPADVLLRLHILLGLQVAPVFAWTAPFVTPLVVVAHARAQLELLEVLLETEVPCGFTFFSRVRMYCALCSAAVAAVAAPLLAVAELDLFYPGMNEAAQGHVFSATYRDTTDAVGGLSMWVPPANQRLDLSDYLALDLGLSSDPLEAWLELNAADNLAPVQDAITLLHRGAYAFSFYPRDCETDRAARCFLQFNVFGIAGALAIEEPEVDPAGFYI